MFPGEFITSIWGAVYGGCDYRYGLGYIVALSDPLSLIFAQIEY